jgi:hypothetical protein
MEVEMRGMQSRASHPVILVVEDLESLRETMQQILEEADYLSSPRQMPARRSNWLNPALVPSIC